MPKDSQNPLHVLPIRPSGAALLTMADAFAENQRRTDISAARRKMVESSVNLVIRSAGLPANAIPFSVASIREHLMDKSAAALGVSKGRRDNAVCDVRNLCVAVGIVDADPPAIAPAWEALLGSRNAYERAPFIRAAKYATLRCIDPDQVDDAFFADFSHWAMTRVLIAHPIQNVGRFRRAWNAAAKSEPGWPRVILALPARASDYVIPFERFPASLQADVDAFLTCLATNNRAAVFDMDSPPLPVTARAGRFSGRPNKPMRATTIRTRRDHVRWALSATVATGVPIEEITSLAALFTPETRPREILRFFYERAGKKPSPAGTHVGEVLSMIAKILLGLPEDRIAKLREWRRPVFVQYDGMTPKNEKLLRALFEPSRYARLLRLPFTVMTEAEKRLADEPQAAVSLAMRALALQILLNLPPLRLANLIGLHLDEHLLRDDPKRSLVTSLYVPEDLTKNSRMIARPIGRVLAEMIEVWVKKFRPLRAGAGNLFLFPGLGQKSITAQAMRYAVRGITREVVGVAVNPHAFRHFNAVDFLKKYPGQYKMVQKLLNHGSIETTLDHYVGVETDEAHEIFDAHNDARQGSIRQHRTVKKPPPRGPKPRGH